jgi:hypothetical protein
MKKLGWILALCLGAGGLYYAATELSKTLQPQQQQPQ